ncbi:MAG TPA: methionine--tRNA ligase subunit beta [Candidatus Paceibacterota bacterium]
MITLHDFKKVELRVGKIVSAERVEGSEKLLKLRVDVGDDSTGSPQARKILAGIGKVYEPDDLVGREVVVVVNLEPKMMMGLESQGMVLAADDNGPVIISPISEVTPGSEVR